MKVFLHIGLEKTGTTTIQRVFDRNREYFKEKGFFYPNFDGEENHVSLYNYARSEKVIDELRIYAGLKTPEDVISYRERFSGAFKEKLLTSGYENVVLSTEHLSSRLTTEAGIARVKRLISSVTSDVKVVLYIRNIIDFFVSSYSTAVKCGETRGLDQFCETLDEYRYQFDKVVQNWSEVFGKENIILREFARDKLVNGDILDDFADVIGLDFDRDELNIQLENESLTYPQAEFLRKYNQIEPLIKNGSYNTARGNIVEVLSSLKDFKGKIRLSQEEFEEAKERLSPVMERLAEYDDRISHMHSLQLPESIQERENIEDDLDFYFQIFSALWEKKGNR